MNKRQIATAACCAIGLAMTTWATEPVLIGAKSSRPSVSDDGSIILFESAARLTSDDKNRIRDIYVFDQNTKKLRRLKGVSSTSNGGSAVSGDGKMAAFHAIPVSHRRNEVIRTSEIILQQINGGTPAVITKGFSGQRNDGEALYPSLNFDGSSVLFTASSTNLLSEPKMPVRDMFIYDVNTQAINRLLKSGEPPNRMTAFPRLSRSGSAAVFLSAATNLDKTLPVNSLGTHLYLLDVHEGIVSRLDVFEKGFDPGKWSPQAPDIDSGGNVVVFEGRQRDPENIFKSLNSTDLFLYERATGQIKLITRGIFSTRAKTPSISGNGQFIAFVLRPDLSTKDSGGIVVYNRETDEWKRTAEGICANPVISKDGGTVVFERKEKNSTNVYVVANPFKEEPNVSH